MGNHIRIMDSIQLALKEDNRTAMAFLISIPGLLLCCAGLHYTPARIFYYEKFSGTSLMLKYLGSVPNMLSVTLLCFSSYCLNVFLIEHRQDKGVVTGILDDSGTAFQCFTTGAVITVCCHLVYMVTIPNRLMELKAERVASRGF